jgi:putative flippase GtrA
MAVRDLIDRYGGKALRYSAVSIIGVVTTEALLIGLLVADVEPWIANLLAVSIASLPVYLLNRAWVWNKSGAHSFSREVVPFWGMSLLGLALSTIAIVIVSNYTTATLVIAFTNLAAFGVLWVGKFMILEKVLFKGGEHEPLGEALAESEPWVAAPHEDA